MRIVKPSVLRRFYTQHKDAEGPLRAFIALARKANWKNIAEVRQVFATASYVGDRIVINIGGNKYRLVIIVRCRIKTVFVRFIGTHKQYDEIDVAKV